MKPQTVELLQVIAGELGRLPNRVAVEGHTDSRAYSSSAGQYTNWELSADRANAARRVLVGSGLADHQIEAVRGYADTRLRTPDDPVNPGNRRISIIVRRG
jgi:chemotaxis protein MotB